MAFLSGIQLASQLVENTAGPLDKKMMLSNVDRLALSETQRWIGMIVYSTDDSKWVILSSNPSGATTDETHWDDFVTGSSSGVSIGREIIVVDSVLETNKAHTIADNFVNKSECILLNGIELAYGHDYTLSGRDISFVNDVIFTDDILVIKYILG